MQASLNHSTLYQFASQIATHSAIAQSGHIPVVQLPRFCQDYQTSCTDDVHWRLSQSVLPECLIPYTRGFLGAMACLDLHVDIMLECQRCLAPLPQRLTAQWFFQLQKQKIKIYAVDEEIATLNAKEEDKLLQLIEDELLLQWPLVPKHAQCEHPYFKKDKQTKTFRVLSSAGRAADS